MKIAINLTRFIPGEMGGMEIYLKGLVHALQQCDVSNSYQLLCDTHYKNEFQLTNPSFTMCPWNYTRPSWRWLVRGLLRNTVSFDMLRPAFNRLEVDIAHHPFSMLNPVTTQIPAVLTFHDMQHEFYPEFFSTFDIGQRRAFYRQSAEEAVRIIAISEHAKSCLVEQYGINAQKIDVIYNGCSPQFHRIDDHTRVQDIRQKYGLPEDFMVYPAAAWPHKNHKRLLKAIKLLRETGRFVGELVLTGVSVTGESSVTKEIHDLGLEQQVRVLGYLPYEELPVVYNAARLLVFPSLFEGFGIPVVEAMACGCPVACSNRTSLPEIVGDAAVMFDPDSIEDIADAITRLWNDDTVRRGCITRGIDRAFLFSWEATAQKTIATYQRALQDRY